MQKEEQNFQRVNLSHPPPPRTTKSSLSLLENIRTLHWVTFYVKSEFTYFQIFLLHHLHHSIVIFFLSVKSVWLFELR